jgi:N-carbamoyl-L-amino-acid hydrolase
VPSGVRLWIDGRTPDAERLIEWRESLVQVASELSARTGVEIELATASHSDAVELDPGVRAALGDLPELVCFAGHDAGILAPRVRAGMVFVRNATGVSHAPDEHVDLADAAIAAEALRTTLERLA